MPELLGALFAMAMIDSPAASGLSVKPCDLPLSFSPCVSELMRTSEGKGKPENFFIL